MLKSPLFFSMLRFCQSLAVLLICLALGKGISWLIDGLLPGSIIGMLLLTLGLKIKFIKLDWVESGASFILRWLSLLFVPLSVALVDQFVILKNQGLNILLILVVSTLLVMFFSGRLWQWLEKPDA